MPVETPSSTVQIARRQAEQHAQRVERLLKLDLELGDRRFGVGKERRRLLHVELRRPAGLEAHARDLEAVALHAHVVACDREARFDRPDADVGGGDLRDEAHQHVVVVGDGGEQIGVGRLDAATEASPEIDLPGRIEARLEAVEAAVDDWGDRVEAQMRTRVRAAQCLALWPEPADRDAATRLRLDDAQARGLERRVLAIGECDEVVERGVAEDLPPTCGFAGVGTQARRAGGQPALGGRRRRRAIVRPDHAAGHEPRE